MTNQPTSAPQLIQDCKSLADAGKLDAFEVQTLEAIEEAYFSSGSISMAEMKFLVSLLEK